MPIIETTEPKTAVVVGSGSIGKRHITNFETFGFRRFILLRSHKDAPPTTIPRQSADTQIVEVQSWDEVERYKPAVAIIANPSSLHLGHASEAVYRGLDVLIEKPIGNSVEQGHQFLQQCNASDSIVMVGCQFRFHPLYQKLRSLVQNKECGTIIQAHADWGEYLPDWHPWEDYRSGYSSREELGGGVLLTLIHCMDYLFDLCGPFKSVSGHFRKVPELLETACEDDAASISILSESAVMASINLNYVQKPPVHQLSLVGTKLRLFLDFNDGCLIIKDREEAETIEKVPEGFTRNDLFLAETKHFLECCDNRKTPLVSVEDGHYVMQQTLLVKKGTTIK